VDKRMKIIHWNEEIELESEWCEIITKIGETAVSGKNDKNIF
jgi:hypothetical protein